MFFGNALIVGEWELVAWGRKSYSGPAEIASFSSLDFSETISMTHSDMLYQLNICKFYFYESFLYQIFVPWKFMKLRSFIFKFDLNVKKKLFSSRIYFFFWRLFKGIWITCCTHMRSHAIMSRRNNEGNNTVNSLINGHAN